MSARFTAIAGVLLQRLGVPRGNAVLENTLWLYAVQLTGQLLPLISLPYLARVLSVETFGAIAFAQSIFFYLSVATEYGFDISATRQVARDRGSPDAVSQTYSAVMVAKGVLCVLALIVLLAAILLVGKLRAHWALLLVMYSAIIGNWLFPLWLFQGLQLMKYIFVRDFLAKLTSVIVLFAFVRGDRDYVIAGGAPAIGVLLAGIVAFARVRRMTPARFSWPRWTEVRNALRDGRVGFLAASTGALGFSTNMAILGFRGLSTELGYFNAAVRITAFFRMLVSPVSTAIFSHVAHTAARSEREAIAFVARYRVLLVAPFAALTVVLMLAAPLIVSVVLGARYAPALAPILILSIGCFLDALQHVHSTYYMLVCGYDRPWLRIMLVNVVLSIALVVPLLYVLRGSVAVATALISGEAVATIAYWRFYARKKEHLEQRKAAF